MDASQLAHARTVEAATAPQECAWLAAFTAMKA